MKNMLIVSAVLLAFGALDIAAAQDSKSNGVAEAVPYRLASSLRPDVVGQDLEKLSTPVVSKRIRKRDCGTAPGLCPWWEKCCAVFDPEGDTIGHLCVDKKRRCPKPR